MTFEDLFHIDIAKAKNIYGETTVNRYKKSRMISRGASASLLHAR